MMSMSATCWTRRGCLALHSLAHLLCVLALYLASELVIWGLSCALAPAGLEFFASILGMALVFSSMTIVACLGHDLDRPYNRWIKPRVDFINTHIGAGFPMPIVMLSQREALGGREIACILAVFASTNLVSWTVTFLVSVVTLAGIEKVASLFRRSASQRPPPRPALAGMRPISSERDEAMVSLRPRHGPCACGAGPASSSAAAAAVSGWDEKPGGDQVGASEAEPSSSSTRDSLAWEVITASSPSILAFSAVLAIGLPVTLVTNDDRLMDGFVLCFLWITAVRLQRTIKTSWLPEPPRQTKNIVLTAVNPILITTLLTLAYTRVKAAAMRDRTLAQVLETLSSGTPLSAILTAGVTGKPVAGKATSWFGAGDAALSLLECGILTWGFKLYECRRQLFSAGGALAVVMCLMAAAGNVSLSVLAGHVIGLEETEALAFAARSTTLALARPAMEAVGGNQMVNATLVVSNGMLGQLMYPFALDKLGVRRESKADVGRGDEEGGSEGSSDRSEGRARGATSGKQIQSRNDNRRCQGGGEDDVVTVAAGVTVGVNGAAMGVSYLYETGSRAAPYAALSMAVFGVMTVVLTTVSPLRQFVVGLASS